MHHYNLYLPLKEQSKVYRYFASFLSFIFSVVVKARNTLYDYGIIKSVKVPGFTISIGNLTLGGTGKSPVLMQITQDLLEKRSNPAILTRGYKSSLKKHEFACMLNGKIIKKNFNHNSFALPDEARMYSQKLPTVPVIIGRNRSQAAFWFLNLDIQKVSHWILDDGFQHRQISRDYDLVLLDAKKPFGNGKLFPLGSLREPLSSLKRADCICFTRADENFPSLKDENTVSHFSKPIFNLQFDFKLRSLNPEIAFTKEWEPVLLMCGIAQPEYFLSQIQNKNIEFAKTYIVPDHGDFDRQKMQGLLKDCKSILSTEKDYWRNPLIFSNIDKPCFLAELELSPLKSDSNSLFTFLYHLNKKL